MKIKQIRETAPEDLAAQLKDARAQILQARIKKDAAAAGGNPLKVRTLRRDVARMLTVERERELAGEKNQK